MNRSWIAWTLAFFATLMAGILLLLIEYKSGLFTRLEKTDRTAEEEVPPPGLVPASVVGAGQHITVKTHSGQVLFGGLGQDSRLENGRVLTINPQSGFALVGVKRGDIAGLRVIVHRDGRQTEVAPYPYGDGYAYVPGAASEDSPAEMQLYWSK